MPLFRRKKKRKEFTMSLVPVMRDISPGESATATVSLSPSGKEASMVRISAGTTAEGGALQPGVSIAFDPPLGVPYFSSVMKVSTTTELAPGAYSFLITAAGEDMRQLATYTLIVRLKGAPRKPATKLI